MKRPFKIYIEAWSFRTYSRSFSAGCVVGESSACPLVSSTSFWWYHTLWKRWYTTSCRVPELLNEMLRGTWDLPALTLRTRDTFVNGCLTYCILLVRILINLWLFHLFNSNICSLGACQVGSALLGEFVWWLYLSVRLFPYTSLLSHCSP